MSSKSPHPTISPLPRRRRSAADALSGIWAVTLTSALFAGLYFGREVLIPLSLAALITFLLSPLVSRLQRWLGNVAAVLAVMLMILGAAVTTGWVLGQQAVDLANQLPSYKENLSAKLRSIQPDSGGVFSKLSETVEDLKKDIPGGGDGPGAGKHLRKGEGPMEVEVVNDPDESPLEMIRSLASPVLGPLGTGGLVFLLATFMLLKRDDLQGRLIRLIGQGRISATTRAMNDAGTRVRRYLLMQLVVNVTYGIPLAIGLHFIGVPNAVLWGALAAVLRFIPYIGPWIAAAFPVLLSLAVAPGWAAPLLTIGLFITLELISNNVLEPWLYGSSTGVSPIALIVAAVFWTWLWGIAGLVLATPFTVCLVVMGRHIPQLSFLSVVLGEDEALTPAEDCYHRLLSRGEHDEVELADSFLQAGTLAGLYDSMLIPVMIATEEDHRLGAIDSEQRSGIVVALRELLDELEARTVPPPPSGEDVVRPVTCRVQGIAARGERDELAGAMMAHVLNQAGYEAGHVPAKRGMSEVIEALDRAVPDLICISVVAPSKALHARNLVQKIRDALPGQKFVVGLWGRDGDIEDDSAILREAGVEEVFTRLADLANYVERLALRLGDHTEPAALPANEDERLATLERLGLVNADREPVLDHITAKLARVFETPIAAITLVDRERQWFKAQTGLPEALAEKGDVPRDLSFCGHVVAADGAMVVRDLKRDRRFSGNPMVLEHGIRFYAGAPIRAANGLPIGALCIMDTSPRRFTARDQRMLEENARDAGEEIERMAETAG